MAEPYVKPPESGEVLAGKYRVERVLGVGGMGMVVAAHHLQLDERVALKFLLPETTVNAEAVKRFIREARAAVKIKSDHVARVSDVGTLENGAPYLVMEYLEGADLASELERKGPFRVEEAVEFVLQACEAIAEAHSLGIVHRDLKPANLFLTRRAGGAPWIKVLDFGISKLSRGPDVAMTSTSAVMGSPLYMSPEQIRASREVDVRADVWALGVILYELLCGRLPFKGDTLPQLSVNIALEPPDPFPAMIGVAPALQAAVFRCLEKDRDRRFANVAELAQALAPFGGRRAALSVERIGAVLAIPGSSLPPSSVPPSSVQATSATTESRGQPFTAPSESTGSNFGRTGVGRFETTGGARPRRGIWALALGLGALAALGAVLLMRSNEPAPAVAASSASVTSKVVAPSSTTLVQPEEPKTPASPLPTPAPSSAVIVAPVASAPVVAEPAAAPSTSAVAPALQPARIRGRKSAAPRPGAPSPAELPRPASTPAVTPPPARPAPQPEPGGADVFNNRTF